MSLKEVSSTVSFPFFEELEPDHLDAHAVAPYPSLSRCTVYQPSKVFGSASRVSQRVRRPSSSSHFSSRRAHLTSFLLPRQELNETP